MATSLLLDGTIIACIFSPLEDELRRVLVERFEWTPANITAILEPLLAMAETVHRGRHVTVSVDPDDDRVLECALESGVSTIVTGDDHLLRLGQFEEIEIITPRAFLESLST